MSICCQFISNQVLYEHSSQLCINWSLRVNRNYHHHHWVRPLAEKQGRPFPGFESHPLNIGDWKCNSIFESHPVSCVEEWTLELKKVIGSHPMDSVHATKGRLGQQISAKFRKCSKLSWPPPPLENWAPKSEMKCFWTGNAPPHPHLKHFQNIAEICCLLVKWMI